LVADGPMELLAGTDPASPAHNSQR